MKRKPILQSLSDFKFLCLVTMLLFSFVRVVADDPRLVIDPGGHTALIKQIIFTRDGRHLISAGDDKMIRVWEVATGKVVRTIQGEIEDGSGEIYAAALSPDEQYLAVCGFLAGIPEHRYGIRIHDFHSGEVVRLLKGHEEAVFSLAFSPDGRWLASGSGDQTVRIWDWAAIVMKDPKVLRGHADAVEDVDFSPDGRRVVSASWDRSLLLWDVASGAKLADLAERHTDEVWSVAFSPDGQYIVSGGDDKRVLMWEGKTGKFIKELYKQGSTVDNLCFSPDGKRLLTSGGNGEFVNYLLAFPSGQVITRFNQHDSFVLATAFAPGGKLVATGGGSANLIHLWNPESGKIIRTLGGKSAPVWAVGFARDGQSIAFGTKAESSNISQYGPLQRTVTLASVDEANISLGGVVKNEADYLRARTTVGDNTLKTTTTLDPNLQIISGGQVFKTITRDRASGYVHRCYTFSGDGRYFVSGGGNGFLTLYETGTGKMERQFVGHTGTIWAVAVSPDNQTLVSGSNDQTIKLWDIVSGRNLLTIFVTTDNEWVAWTPEGYYTSSLNGDQYIGWHVNQGVDKAAKFYAAAQFKDRYRPDVVAEYLKTRDIQLALKAADEKRGRSFTASAPATTIAASYPPVVFIAAPDKDVSDTEMVMVRAEAKSVPNTLPVNDLKVLVNGVKVGGASGSRWEGQVRLQPGENTLAVIAANEKAVSEPEVKKITFTGRGTQAKPNLVLLAIGVKAYQNRELSLGFADQDALKMASMFQAQEGLLFNKVHIKTLTNEQVTRDAVLDGLDWMNGKSSQNDVVVLFLSGHGGLHKGNYYFWTHQHNPAGNPERYDVKWSTLIDELTEVSGTKPILFVDSCRAAAVTGSRRKGDDGLTEALKDLKQNYQGVVFFAASKDNEDSIEMDSLGHGAFTYVLLEGLKGRADGQPADRVVYINELGSWVRTEVWKLTQRQNGVYEEPPAKSGFQPFPIFALPRQ